MMEVTPHLKSVLKNYQYSATKSLHGPGLSLNTTIVKIETPSPEDKSEDEFQPTPTPFPVQQVPILAAPDTSCSERSETILEGEGISCFVVGGEKRLCLPQVLNSVLRDFSLQEINRECDQLQIYCSRCTPEQLNVLKTHGILPSGAPSCGLITKTDAERLCSALLISGSKNVLFRARKGATSFPVYHECFGEARGRCYPDLYTNKQARCIECVDCQNGFSPQQFVCHVHRNLENRTVHWGFDSSSHWRSYLHIPDEQSDKEGLMKVLDELRDRYEGKVPFPPPPLVIEGTVKRKQIAASDLVKDHQTSVSELPLKKQKFDDFIGLRVPPFALPTAAAAAIMQQHIYAMEPSPAYLQRCLQEYNNRSHLSAFKPVTQCIREQKLRSASAMGLTSRCAADPPLLQNPEKVVMMSESERFERSYQPNVALAPPTPKKHRYGRAHETSHTSPQSSPDKEELATVEVNGHDVKDDVDTPEKIDSTVSVVQPPARQKYNPEIELSTDTEDSASETSEKNIDFVKLEEVLKSVNNDDVKDKIMDLFRNLAKERERAILDSRTRDQDRISELERRNTELEQQNSELQRELDELQNNNRPIRDSIIKSDLEVTSSIVVTKAEESCPSPSVQTSVICVAEAQDDVVTNE